MGNKCTKLPIKKCENNPLDTIDKPIRIPNACAPNNYGYEFMKNLIPDNNEYEWIGQSTSDCHYCSLKIPTQVNCPVGNTNAGSDCFSILGGSGYYTRKKYSANKCDCCLNELTTINGKTCDPKYRNIANKDCSICVFNHCKKDFNIFEDERCKKWCITNKEKCNYIKKVICTNNKNINNKHCLNWCMENQGQCDQSMKYFCDNPENYNLPICSCFNSTLKNHNITPACERKCSLFGYKTNSLSKTPKCDFIDCNMYLTFKNTGNITFENEVNLKQKCGSTNIPNVGPKIENVIKHKKFPYIIIIISLFCFLVIFNIFQKN